MDRMRAMPDTATEEAGPVAAQPTHPHLKTREEAVFKCSSHRQESTVTKRNLMRAPKHPSLTSRMPLRAK
eukprot:4493967-Amphidinium_carterae.1